MVAYTKVHYNMGQRLEQDELLVNADKLEAMLCEHELRILLAGGWWYLVKASQVIRQDPLRTNVELTHCLLSAARRGKGVKIYTSEVPENQQFLVKVSRHK